MWGVSRRFRLQGCPGLGTNVVERKMRPAAYSQRPEPWARLKFHAGWSGWTRPPTMAGGAGGDGQAEACLQGGVEGVFKGI